MLRAPERRMRRAGVRPEVAQRHQLRVIHGVPRFVQCFAGVARLVVRVSSSGRCVVSSAAAQTTRLHLIDVMGEDDRIDLSEHT